MKKPEFISLGQSFELKIESLAFNSGYGVSRYQGFVIFVPFSAPGDILLATVMELHSSYAVARVDQLINPSPHRRKPLCPVVGRCGGCQWQQVSYEEQIRQKQNILISAFKKLHETRNFTILPFLPAPSEYRYRRRIQLHRHSTDIGYYATGSHDLVPIEDCWIAETKLVDHFPQLRIRAHTPGAPQKERCELALEEDGSVRLRPTRSDFGSLKSESLVSQGGLFAQVNSAQNKVLKVQLLQSLENFQPASVLDLYCGNGNLTFPLAEQWPHSQVWAVDLSEGLMKQAQFQSKKLNRHNIVWHKGRTSEMLKKFHQEGSHWPRPLLVVLDPPRSGCDSQTRSLIPLLKPDKLIYVSCNPMTLVRDISEWIASGSLQLESVQGLDMFPQTPHIEVLAVLQGRR